MTAPCWLRFLSRGPDSIVSRDLGILTKWTQGLGVIERGGSLVEVVKRLGRAGEGRLVWLRLKQRGLPNGYVEWWRPTSRWGASAMADGFASRCARWPTPASSAAKRIVGKTTAPSRSSTTTTSTWFCAPKARRP